MLKPIPLHHIESERLILDPNIDTMFVEKSAKEAHWRGAINLLASILGTGLLSMPGACKNSGMLFFCLASTLAALTCHTTAVFLVRTVKFLAPLNGGEDSTYAGLAAHVYGISGERAIQFGLVLQQIGACVGYIVVIGDVFSPIVRLTLISSVSETTIRNIFVWCLMFPLTVGTKNLASLRFASAAAVFAICLFSFAVIANGILVGLDPINKRMELLKEEGRDVGHQDLVGPFWFPSEIVPFISAIPLISFAYDMHFNAVPVHEDMRVDIYPPKSAVNVFTSASFVAFALSLAVTVATGLAGYFSFLSATKPDILSNFAVKDTYISMIMNVVRGLYGLGLALAFPMIVWELRQVIFFLTLGTDSVSNSTFWIVTAGIFALTSVLVLTVDNVTTVFGLVGSTVTPSLDYVVPAVLYIKSGCAARFNDSLRAHLILFSGVFLIPLGLGVWIYQRIY